MPSTDVQLRLGVSQNSFVVAPAVSLEGQELTYRDKGIAVYAQKVLGESFLQ